MSASVQADAGAVALDADVTGTAGVEADPQRWTVLVVLCLSLLIVGIDGTIVNVALPTLVRELHATSSQLQWIVDAYTIVFASLLLLAGNAGDRLGRKGALIFGLVIFGAGSAASAFAGSANVLIATRAIQGFGGAFIMPTTLSILTNVFPDAAERSRAIAIWAGVSGLGVAIGPLAGGFLLEHFWWGSIFLINVPIIIGTLIAVVTFVPKSRDPHAPRLDLLGTVLVTFGLVGVLYSIIEGPTRGWTDPLIVGGFVVGAALLTAFTLWELHTDHPILDVTFFQNPRFTAASIAITLVFFAMFGVLFFLSQYLQFVLGYSALKAGAALIPVAVVLMIAAPTSAKLVAWVGTKVIVTIGLGLVGLGMLIFAGVSVDSGYLLVLAVLVVVGAGMGLAMAPATDSIMGSLPPERAGVGSAVNDTTREIGGALGVAILGSITAAAYSSKIQADPQYDLLAQQSPEAAKAITDSVGGAATVAAQLPAQFAQQVTDAANAAFVHALKPTVIVGAIVAFIGAAVAAIFLPARADVTSPEGEDLSDLVTQTAQHLPIGARPPRDAVRAVLGLLADSGFSSLSFNGIATRSGISTATLDRYWGSRVDAVADAVEELFGTGEVPHTGSLRTDCEQHLAALADSLSSEKAAPVLSTLLSEAASQPELARELRERILAPRRVELVGMVRSGIERGDLPPDSDANTIADLLVAPLFHRALVTGQPITPRFVDQVIETVLASPPQMTPV
jgi:EmrB/QacA subfamily drug resistance transporter